MEEAMVSIVTNYGVLGVIFLVFIKGYYEDKKDNKDFKLKQLGHEKELAVILSQTTETMKENKQLIVGHEIIHKDMGRGIKEIDDKLNRLIESSNQFEVINAVNSIKDMLQESFN